MNTNADSSAPPKHQKTEAMAKMFRAARNSTHGTLTTYEPESWKPVLYFFYGTLMDEKLLTGLLHLKYPPILRPASIVNYSIKMWGPYPALTDGPPGNVVNGMAYEVQEEGHEKRLAYYETDAYRCVSCFIKPASGGDQISGKTFVWAGDPNDLRPGTFELGAQKNGGHDSQ
ncbi:hypothetical protein BJ322DRAFT_853824 [Thelephora terrestris]|uniref:Putative gamma-glutamylcyclotransferase n=1 Tax=Thelephora terrestris TaxID=56493 RepID=A0A9P6L6P1_9AGAM|nr:hypothetical protein BJ322DRAFT_853824 [Thelephora terrestris]